MNGDTGLVHVPNAAWDDYKSGLDMIPNVALLWMYMGWLGPVSPLDPMGPMGPMANATKPQGHQTLYVFLIAARTTLQLFENKEPDL